MLKKYPDFWHTLVGPGPVGAFLAFCIIAFVCALVSILIGASNRELSSNNTPVKFSWRFLLAANLLRIVANFLLIPIFIRLLYENFGPTAMMFWAVGIGFGVDGLAAIAKNMGLLTTNKLAANIAKQVAANDPVVIPKQ